VAESLAGMQSAIGRIGAHLQMSDARQDEMMRVVNELSATVERLRRDVDRQSAAAPSAQIAPSAGPARRGLILAGGAGGVALAGWLVTNWRNLIGMLRYLADLLLRLPPPPPPPAA
jgi:outer membrane murein-binding lipoprotein Lpp